MTVRHRQNNLQAIQIKRSVQLSLCSSHLYTTNADHREQVSIIKDIMEKSIELKLQKLVPAIIDYLKVNKPNGGIVDVATSGEQIVNYWINQKEIPMGERVAAKSYLSHLIGLGFKNPIPEHARLIVREMMINETGITSTAKILAEKIYK